MVASTAQYFRDSLRREGGLSGGVRWWELQQCFSDKLRREGRFPESCVGGLVTVFCALALWEQAVSGSGALVET